MTWLHTFAIDALATLVEASAQATVLLVVAAVASLLAWRASAATRHLVWTLGIAGCLAVPVLRTVVPAQPVVGVPASSTWLAPAESALRAESVATAADPAESHGTRSMSADAGDARDTDGAAAMGHPPADDRRTGAPGWPVILVALWSSGSIVLLARILGTAILMRRLVTRASPASDPRWRASIEAAARTAGLAPGAVDVRLSGGRHAPLVWALGRPVVLLPADADGWDDGRREQVLHHELAHVRRGDGVTQLLAAIATAVYWFHPLVWLAARRMLVERERACDDRVLAAGIVPADYAHHLLDLARRLPRSLARANLGPAMARRGEMAGRLLALLDTGRARRAPGRPAVTAAVACALLVAAVTASLTPAGTTAAPATGPSDVAGRGGGPIASPANGTASESDDPSLTEVEAHIATVNRACERALRERDIDALVAPYSPDIVQWGIGGVEHHGRGELREVFVDLVDRFRRLDIETTEILRIADDVVHESGRIRFTEGRDPRSLTCRYVSVWRRENGAWKIYRDLYSF